MECNEFLGKLQKRAVIAGCEPDFFAGDFWKDLKTRTERFGIWIRNDGF